MATFAGYTVHVIALCDRDLDDQVAQLESLPHVSAVEFFGVPGGGSYFAVAFDCEPPRPMQAVLDRCDLLVKRASCGDWSNSEVLSAAASAAFANLGGYVEAGRL